MKIKFLGATGTVTGSKYLISTNQTNILVDCGLFQGYKNLRERNWQAFPIDVSSIDAVVLTHAHLDHSGMVPLLYKYGYRGPIYCTKATYALCQLLLPDSAHIQEEDAKFLTTSLKKFKIKTEILFGKDTLNKLVSLEEVDTVVCAISGSAGLESSLNAVQSGKKILLANKESLVMCGSLFMDLAEEYNSIILPVDSEHNALHQCFASNSTKSIEKIILTASGGPFLESNINELKNVTPEQALNHPTWSMGKKISIDSATMMNKGLEIIEAMYLFKLEISQIDTLIHPQSLIHSMVCYKDGSVIMQASKNDMKIPISYCLGWPKRISSGIEPIDLTKQSSLNFFEAYCASPDFKATTPSL